MCKAQRLVHTNSGLESNREEELTSNFRRGSQTADRSQEELTDVRVSGAQQLTDSLSLVRRS